MTENAIVPTIGAYLTPIADVMAARIRYQATKDFIEAILRHGVDFGEIPGTTKPTLLKPGAEKLATYFGLLPMFDVIDKTLDWMGADHNGEPFFFFTYRCDLIRDGAVVAQGEGSANSWEKKYRWRQSELLCPNCEKPAIKKSKFPPRDNPKAAPGWYCHDKAGGCGANFSADDKRIIDQPRGQVPNPDIYDIVNTLQKMAQKRAYIAAVLLAVNGSEYFTQDVEDFIDVSWIDNKQQTAAEPAPTPAQYTPINNDRPARPAPPTPKSTKPEPTDTPMTYAQACDVTNSKGDAYGTLSSETLSMMVNPITSKMNNDATTPDEKTECRRKLAAIEVILNHREAVPAEPEFEAAQ